MNNRCCPVPVSTGWEQDAQFLSSHGGCLSTAVVRYQCSRKKVLVHTGVVRSCVFLAVSGNVNLGLLVSTGPIFVFSSLPSAV